ncbi:MAG: UDP-N-acetylmuramate dehydrogenase [Acidobacteriota bacterium]
MITDASAPDASVPDASAAPPRLADLTTLGVGGPPRRLVDGATADDLAALLRDDPALRVLGGGSNLLVADAGVDATVVRLARGRIAPIRRAPDAAWVRVDAGVPWDALVAWAVDAGLSGLAGLSGIPGSVGAAPIQNIGAYGESLDDTLVAVEVMDRRGARGLLAARRCGFGYRWSHFRGPWRDRFFILGIVLRLPRRATCPARYPELARTLGCAVGADAPLAAVRDAVLAIRRRKAMVRDDPHDPDQRSAGSFFVNPIVTTARADAIRDAVAAAQPDAPTMPRYAVDGADRVKLSAAWLIERAGFRRGETRGRAGLSRRHVLALTNRGGASADALLQLAATIRRRVANRFGVTLRPEPVFWGFDQPAGRVLDARGDADHHPSSDTDGRTPPP